MRLFGKGFAVADFMPPILSKAVHYLRKGNNKYHRRTFGSFDHVPLDIDAALILDIGANVGQLAVAALKTYPSAKVICFEPVKSTFEELKANLAPYAPRVELYNLAVTDKTGETEINVTNYHEASSLVKQSAFYDAYNPDVRAIRKERIKTISLDEFAPNLPTCEVDILKIDVEGMELSVLKGGKEFIQRNVDTLMIEVSLQRDASWESQTIVAIFVLLQELGFRLINMYDLCKATGAEAERPASGMMLTQVDCVFRNQRKLVAPQREGVTRPAAKRVGHAGVG